MPLLSCQQISSPCFQHTYSPYFCFPNLHSCWILFVWLLQELTQILLKPCCPAIKSNCEEVYQRKKVIPKCAIFLHQISSSYSLPKVCNVLYIGKQHFSFSHFEIKISPLPGTVYFREEMERRGLTRNM